jgi:DNA modification methylase/chemotaxis regulatin CheY-phosphate phosphatase CheZ
MARNLLREDGAIFVSIDDNEAHNLKLLMDEVFGEENFVANVIWEKNFSPKNDSKYLSENHDHILVFSKNKEVWRPTLLPRSEEANARYSNPDNDDRGNWTSGDLSVKTYSREYDYPITTPSGKLVFPPKGGCWRVSKIKLEELIEDNRIWFGEKGENTPRLKRFLSEVKEGMTSLTIWERVDVGDNQEARREIRDIFNDVSFFDTPKPTRLLKRILQLSTKSNDQHIIMDFFAGSSTIAQSVLELNAEDGGNRRFVLVQLPEPTDPKSEAFRAGYESIAAIGRERIRRVIKKMYQAINETDNEIASGQRLLETLQKELSELQAAKPELFGAKPSKETQKLTDQIEKAGESLTEAREKVKRLRHAPKDFKAFRLAKSNFENWRSEAKTKDQIGKLLLDFKSPQRADAESQAMLYEFLLKKGYPLTASVIREEIDGIVVYLVEKGKMWVLLDGYSETIRKRILAEEPKHVVCLDKIFAGNDQTLTNLHLDLRDRNIELSII